MALSVIGSAREEGSCPAIAKETGSVEAALVWIRPQTAPHAS